MSVAQTPAKSAPRPAPTAVAAAASQVAPKKRPRARKGPRTVREVGIRASAEGKKIAAAILEVLGGARTPPTAAEALGCSLPRYYALEARALEGLLAACEPRSAGRQRSPERAIGELERHCARLERECARAQALVRASHRAIGLPAPPSRPSKPGTGRKRRPKRPAARALVAAKAIAETKPATGTAPPDAAPSS